MNDKLFGYPVVNIDGVDTMDSGEPIIVFGEPLISEPNTRLYRIKMNIKLWWLKQKIMFYWYLIHSSKHD